MISLEPLTQIDPPSLGELYRAFWGENRSVLLDAIYTDTRMSSLRLVALAGLSEALGHSVLLFVHGVRPVRFVLSLLFSMALFVVNFVVWVLSLWFVATFLLDLQMPQPVLVNVAAIAYVPLLLGFVVFLPYLGYPLGQILYALSLVGLVRLLVLAFSITWSQALLCAIFGFLLTLLLRTTVGRPVIWLGTRLQNAIAGTTLDGNIDQVVVDFSHTLEEEL